MRDRLAAIVAAALLPAVCPGPVSAADDLPTVRAKVPAAMQAAKSFVASAASQSGFTVTTTYVAPDRYHSVLNYNGSVYDVVLVGPTAYLSTNGNPYTTLAAPPQVLAVQQQLRTMPVDAVDPDTTVDGVTYGQFETTQAGPQRDQHLTCTYDKTTYRIARCTGTTLNVSFARYDDPANAVTVPANVAKPSHADLPTVRTKVALAMRAASSFVVTSSPASGAGRPTTTIFVAPDRYRYRYNEHDANFDTIVVGETGYIASPGQPYAVIPGRSIATALRHLVLHDVVVEQLAPDVVIGGIAYGRFASAEPGGRNVRLTCTYDKASYRLVSCASVDWHVAFSRYDDPSNVVAVPANLVPPASGAG